MGTGVELGDVDALQAFPSLRGANISRKIPILKGLQCHGASLCMGKDQVHHASPYHEDASKSNGGITDLACQSPSLGHIQLQNAAPLPSHPKKQLPQGSAQPGPGSCITPMMQPGIAPPRVSCSDAVGHKPRGSSPVAEVDACI